MWNLNDLTRYQVVSILKLLHDPRLQQEIYANPLHPMREFMPFLDQPQLQQQFLRGYARAISTIDPNEYKLKLYF